MMVGSPSALARRGATRQDSEKGRYSHDTPAKCSALDVVEIDWISMLLAAAPCFHSQQVQLGGLTVPALLYNFETAVASKSVVARVMFCTSRHQASD